MKRAISTPIPFTFRPDILESGANVIQTEGPDGPCLVAYDPLHQVAGVYHPAVGMWSIWTPLPLGEFLETLGARGYVLPQGDDLQTWLDAVAELAGVTRQ
jgi:hypothetical protein